MKQSDTICRDLAARDSETLESLVARYRPLVAHVVYRTLSGAGDAEDVCQEVFLRVFQGFPAFRRESKLSTWVARIAYNTCVNHLKKKKEVLLDDLPGGGGGVEMVSAACVLPDEQAERGDLVRLLEEEIRRLPATLRTILTLYHLDAMSYREIGDVMSLPEGTVKSYLFRARRRLRQRLMKKQEEDLRP